MHIIFSLLEITFWKPFREVNERVWTYQVWTYLVCTAKVLSKSTEMEYRVPATYVMSPSSVTSWAVPPFTWWVSYQTRGTAGVVPHYIEQRDGNITCHPFCISRCSHLALSDTLT